MGCSDKALSGAVIPTFTSNDTTPSVALGELFLSTNAAPTTVTQLDDGAVGQRVTIVSTNSNFQITDGGNFRLNGNYSSTADDVLELIWDGSLWREISRSAN